jgi:mannose-6-phosphate isomerase
MLYPITFHPLFKERVWGGRRLEQLYGKALPPGVPIGESWEITDRPEGVSVIANGPLAGRDLRWLMEQHAGELLGGAKHSGHFPLLVKILDAQDKLSLQVHPPPQMAVELGGEPKTEMWYVADATPEADIFVGLRRGVTREEFTHKVADGTVAGCFHRHLVRHGDVMFLPSGRVHALGAGSVIFEIQQNSDTTYRVFDWNRVGLDGKPRELHVPQALASIDFNDVEPPLSTPRELNANFRWELVNHPLFRVEKLALNAGDSFPLRGAHACVAVPTEGEIRLDHGSSTVVRRSGEFCLVPACLRDALITAPAQAVVLLAFPQ